MNKLSSTRRYPSGSSSSFSLRLSALFIFIFLLWILYLLQFSHFNNNSLRSEEEQQKVSDPVVVVTPSSVSGEKTFPPKMKPKIAIAITVTKDGNFVDGALVLGASL